MATVEFKYLCVRVPDDKVQEFLARLEILLEEYAGDDYTFKFSVNE